MQPLPPFASLQSSAAEALEIMRREDATFLPVVTPDTQKFMGVVLRKGVEHACERMGHTPSACSVINHLLADAEFCFADEAIEPLLNQSVEQDEVLAGLRDRAIRTRLSAPIVVVDEHKVPIGLIERSAR